MDGNTRTVMARTGALAITFLMLGLVGLIGAGCGFGFGSDDSGGVSNTVACDAAGAGDVASSDTVPGEDSGGYWPGQDSSAEMVALSDGGHPWGDTGSCIPSCGGKQCGPDGCGGSCGWCSASQSCQGGQCVDPGDCVPQCAGKKIGEDDECGGVCSGGGTGIGLKPGGAQDVGYFRLLVKNGEVPTPDLFPIEGFLNEHDTPLPAPDYDMFATLHAFIGLFYDPEQEEPLIAMQIGLNSGVSPDEIEAKAFNLVVVVDESGSMDSDGKIQMVRSGLLLLLGELDENDIISIVTYEDDAEVLMGPTPVTEDTKPMIAEQIQSLTAEGSTNLYAGMVLGYELAEAQTIKHAGDDMLYRVMLLSDGVVTAGIDDTDTIVAKSAEYNEKGIGITTIGVGTDFNQELMYELANQGGGNFYFIQDAAKLMEVFIHEIEYLMTPVAENLKIAFTLPQGFEVEDIYGYDWAVDEVTGEVKILGPAPKYSVDDPDAPVDPVDPDPDPSDAEQAAATLFASKKNGLLMVKIRSLFPDIFASWEALDFATIHYSYDLMDGGGTESATKVVHMGSLSYFEEDGEGPLAYLVGPIMQRNFCVLRMGLAIKKACTLIHGEDPDIPLGDPDLGGAFMEIMEAQVLCNGIQLALDTPDEAIIDDLELLQDLHDNICTVYDIDCD